MTRTVSLAIGVLLGLFVAVGHAEAQSDEERRQAIADLNWVVGPQTVRLFNLASLSIPDGYQFLNSADTQEFMTLNENPGGGRAERHILAPVDLQWFALLVFENSGYVKDDQSIDADELLKVLQEGSAKSNAERRKRGWSELKLLGWAYPPFYETQTKRLEWATNLESDGASLVNYNSRILGRGGVTSATLVADFEGLDASVADFKNALQNYEYLPGQKYSEFTRGDKVAEYGLAALVAGGAAAVATKTGFWKSLVAFAVAGWKLILGGLVALVALLKKAFTKKDE